MDIGLREWLIVIGIIVIAGILFDGWRRMRGGKGKLKFKLDRNIANLPDDDESTHDVLGPARVVSRASEPELDESDLPSMSSRDSNVRRNREPYQGDLQLNTEEPVPTLLNPVVGEEDDEQEESSKDLPPVEEVLVINVISRDPSGFRGPALLQNILESGLRFGEMDIFHRHESMAGNGEVLFSYGQCGQARGVRSGRHRPLHHAGGEFLPRPARPAPSQAGLRRHGGSRAQALCRAQRRTQG